MKNLVTLLLFATITSINLYAQHVTFPDDNLQRGYYDRPYLRYEAEPGKCTGTMTFLEATDDQTLLQSEASNQVAANLVNKGDYVEWKCSKEASGVTIRFSLPDSENGEGTTGTIILSADNKQLAEIELNSYWAWQYTLKTGNERYPDNTPSDDKFIRMRFDEKWVLLDTPIAEGATFRLEKKDDNTVPYTIDFVELEPVNSPLTFDDITDTDKVQYEGNGSNLQSFINANSGKTIFIPAGNYSVSNRLTINVDNVKIIGAGMWYTSIFFSASSDTQNTYPRRGFECSKDNVTIEGLTIDTQNNKRYYKNNSSYQVGKGFQGSWGKNSVLRDLRVSHFECGAWIADYSGNATYNLLVTGCRFRNNYADGINLCSGVTNSTVEHCSFRNNGDDDMASWSTGNWSENNTFRYNTAENNWRASSIGFFGGKNNTAEYCVVIDALEAGIRAVGDFSGTGFANDGNIRFSNISIYHSGCKSGAVGVSGDFWGNQNGAVNLLASGYYDLVNINLNNVYIHDSRWNAIHIGSSNRRQVTGLRLNDITIDGTENYGIYFVNTSGTGTYSNITYQNIGYIDSNACPSTFTFIPDNNSITDCSLNAPFLVMSDNNNIYITGLNTNEMIKLYDLSGACLATSIADESGNIKIQNIDKGTYIVKDEKYNGIKLIVN
jgi:hypothetical protein